MKKEQKRKISKEEKGITLIALVITIIILLILAGVTLNAALSENGLFKKAKYAAEEYNKKTIEEQVQLFFTEKEMDGGGPIIDDDIEKFNESLEKLGKKIKGIKDENEFKKIGNNEDYPLSGIYVQTGDFPLTDFTPVGNDEGPFTGIYYGNEYSINNLKIIGTKYGTGIFAGNKGTIKGITVTECNVYSNFGGVGVIAGSNTGLIEDCIVVNGTVNVTSNGEITNIGGICGVTNYGGVIKNCINNANVTGTNQMVGEICGRMYYGTIENCENTGKITTLFRSGGIVGYVCGYENVGNSYIKNCLNYGSVSADSMECRWNYRAL